MLPLRRAVLAVFSTALLLGLAWGCSASKDSGSRPSTSGGGSTSIGEAGNDAQILRPGAAGEAGESSLGLNPLCGKAPVCVPDKPGECASYIPPAAFGDAGTDGNVDALSSQAGQSGEGGAGGESSLGAAGASGAAGAAGASADGGAAGASGDSRYSCQVLRSAGAPQSVQSRCAVAGSGGINAPCLSSSDCGWDAKHGALGCVGDASSGLCEPYCCKGDDTCAVGSYCAERPLRDALTNASAQGAAPTVKIPVCVPAQNCDLSTPYPCPAGTECTCQSGMACLVVRADGTTTCAVPGAGKAGDACPCAWGHVCSVATNQCLKLCYTRGTASCGTGTCQASSDLPDGWGVCVGASPSGG